MSKLFWPFPLSTVTEWPGPRTGSHHIGTDFGVPQGTQLRATADGVCSRWVDQYGAYIIDIRTDDGLIVRNGHLSRIDVSNGQRVTAGQVIGLTGGARGTLGAGYSFGPHLHWELRKGSSWINPRNLRPQPSHFGSDDSEGTDGEMRVVKGGTIALLGEYETTVYTSASGAQAFSIEANSKAFGDVDGMTNDQVTTLVNEARARRVNLIASIVNELKPIIAEEIRKGLDGVAPASVDYDAIADTVLSEQSRRLAE